MLSLDQSDQRLLEQLNAHPKLKARMITLLAVVNNAGDDMKRADAAEQKVIEELRQLGNDVLQGWAERQITQRTDEALATPGIHRRGKKAPSLAQ